MMLRNVWLLVAVVVMGSLSPARGEAPAWWVYAMTADGSGVWKQARVADYPIINSPELSPDGTKVAVDGWGHDQDLWDAHLLIIDLNTGEYDDLGPGAMPTWSPDGDRIAYSKYHAGGGVFISLADGREERLIDPLGWAIQWSPDPSLLAYVRAGNLVVYDVSTETRREVFPGASPYRTIYHNCKWSPDGKRICFKGRRSDRTEELAVVTVSGEDPMLRVLCRAEEINPDIAWHPDGARIVVPRRSRGGQPGQLLVLNPDRSDPPIPLAGQPDDRHNGGVCWSRDGETLIFVSCAARPPAAGF